MKAKRILALVTLILIVVAIWLVNTKSAKHNNHSSLKSEAKK